MNTPLFPVKKDGKVGYIDIRGRLVIGFDLGITHGMRFMEGLAKVVMDGTAVYINAAGEVVIPQAHGLAGSFQEGLAIAGSMDKVGFINKTGEWELPPVYKSADDFHEGVARVKILETGETNFIDKTGKVLLSPRNYLVSDFREGLVNCGEPQHGWGYVDASDMYVIPPVYNFNRPFYEGLAAVSPKMINGKPNLKELKGFINHAGEMVIDPVYDGILEFSDGMCAVWNRSFGYIDRQGSLVIPYQFQLGNAFSEGRAVVKPKGKNAGYGYIDKTGEMAIPAKFAHAESFKDGVAAVAVGEEFASRRQGYILPNGDFLWEPSR